MRLFGPRLHFLDKLMSSFSPAPALKSALSAFIVALIGFSATSKGYVLEGKSWPSGTVVLLQLGLGNAGRTLQDGNTSFDDVVFPVAEMWNQRIGRVQVANVMNPGAPLSSSDRLNSVVFTSSVFGQAFGANTLAVTYYSSSGSTMLESDTLFNRAIPFDSYRGPLQFVAHGPAIADIRRVFLHELGHGLGLGHPDQGGQQVVAVMNSIVSNQEVLSADDISGGQFLYGVPALPTPTPTPVPTPTPTPGTSGSHLANISTRMKVGLSQNVLIGGFIIQGSQTKQLILRALGPSLSASGIVGALANPVLELHDAAGNVLASNDDWGNGAQAAQIQAVGFAPNSAVESAIMVTLSPGSYTAVVSGQNGGQGIGLIEAYEMDGTSSRLVNISTRGRVGLGGEPMIGGLIVQGGSAKKVIIRALGPSMTGVLAGVLADPTLELRDGAGNLLATNDDWTNSAQTSEIAATIPPVNALESAIIATLGPGNYTAIVRSVDNSSGVGLVEVFDLDP
ncbi:MAG: hypothetical protein DLM73_14950 [Chthoniobacterales bacterium]|nr:MAG: hypothetical protein DLM73_14950 [Chthoniobacterales bacterium]